MPKKKSKKSRKKHSTGIVFVFSLIVIIFALFLLQSTPKNQQSTVKISKANAAGQVVWQQFDGDANKTGMSDDPYINSSTVTTLAKQWSVPVSADGSPVFLSGVTTAQGVKNLVFVTTQSGGLTAFDEATGTKIWSVTTTGGAGGSTESSPAIDPGNQYIYSYGQDGKVHKYDVGTGTEETTGGWPLTATLIPNVEKGSSALSIGNGYLYVTTSAYPGDAGDYDGHIVAKNLSTGTVTIFNTLCDNVTTLESGGCASRQSGVWSRPGMVVDQNTGNIFIASGNGPYTPPDELGDTLIELAPDLSKIVDTYTPTTFAQLDSADADLGSTDVAIIPSLDLGIQGGKDNKIRVINLKNMSGQGGPDHIGGELQTVSVDCNVFSYPISWNDGTHMWVFVTDMCNNLYAYQVTNNQLTQIYKNGNGGSSPLLVNGVLFIQSSGSVKALNPATGAVLWTGSVGSMHWQSPAIVDGHVFVIDNSNLTAFSVPMNSPTVIETSPVVSTPGAGAPTNFVCLGSCPTDTPLPTPVIPTAVISNPTPGSTLVPCTAVTSQTSGGGTSIQAKKHSSGQDGLVKQLIGFLLQLIQLLLQQLGATSPPPCSQPAATTSSIPATVRQ